MQGPSGDPGEAGIPGADGKAVSHYCHFSAKFSTSSNSTYQKDSLDLFDGSCLREVLGGYIHTHSEVTKMATASPSIAWFD